MTHFPQNEASLRGVVTVWTGVDMSTPNVGIPTLSETMR